jgi:hypothetical protein
VWNNGKKIIELIEADYDYYLKEGYSESEIDNIETEV